MITISRVSVRQIIILLVLSMFALRVIIEPSIMYFAAGRDGWISYIIVMIFQIIGVGFIAYLIKRNPKTSINQVSVRLIGKFLTKVFMFLYFLFFLFRIIGIDYEMQNFLLEAIYDELDWNVFIIPIFLVMIYIAYKGPRVMGRLTEIFLPFAVFVLLYTLIIAALSSNLLNLMPILSRGVIPVLKGAFYGASQMGEFLFLLMIMEHIDFKKEKIIKQLTLTAIITSIIIILFYIIFVSVFGDVAMSLKEGIIRITQFAPTSNSSLRIDGITTVLWLPVSVIMSAICYYCSAKSLMFLFNIKKFSICIIITFTIVLILKFMPFITSNVILDISLNYFSFVSIFLQIVFPAILFIVQLTKKEKMNEKTISQNCT